MTPSSHPAVSRASPERVRRAVHVHRLIRNHFSTPLLPRVTYTTIDQLTLNDLTAADLEGEGFIAITRTIKFTAVGSQCAHIVHREFITFLGKGLSVTGFDHFL